jgi:DNA-binding GntR family transcriptional regulator
MVFISAALLFATTAGAEQIYRWIGLDGATHFSETRPDVDPAGVEILEVVRGDRLSPPSRDYQSVLDVAKAIESSRLERERLRLEKKKLLLQNRQLQQSAMIPQAYDEDYRGVRLYYSPYYRYPAKPRRRHYYRRPVNPKPHSSHHYRQPGHATRTGHPGARVYIRQ